MVVYDPFSDSFRSDRAGVHRRMRDEAPVFLRADGRFAALSRFDDVRMAAVDWQTFSAVTAESKIRSVWAWGFDSLTLDFAA